jgi:hypothetical protein
VKKLGTLRQTKQGVVLRLIIWSANRPVAVFRACGWTGERRQVLHAASEGPAHLVGRHAVLLALDQSPRLQVRMTQPISSVSWFQFSRELFEHIYVMWRMPLHCTANSPCCCWWFWLAIWIRDLLWGKVLIVFEDLEKNQVLGHGAFIQIWIEKKLIMKRLASELCIDWVAVCSYFLAAAAWMVHRPARQLSVQGSGFIPSFAYAPSLLYNCTWLSIILYRLLFLWNLVLC